MIKNRLKKIGISTTVLGIISFLVSAYLKLEHNPMYVWALRISLYSLGVVLIGWGVFSIKNRNNF